MREIGFDRIAAREYAKEWAFSRNPRFYDFEELGGDCTNFASQCLYAGCGVMNPTKTYGWYFYNLNNRTPSWTGVRFLYEFLVTNKSVGPYGTLVPLEEAAIGDIIQLGREDGTFYHSPIVVDTYPEILVAAHSYDAFGRPLSSYSFARVRCIHILGARDW